MLVKVYCFVFWLNSYVYVYVLTFYLFLFVFCNFFLIGFCVYHTLERYASFEPTDQSIDC